MKLTGKRITQLAAAVVFSVALVVLCLFLLDRDPVSGVVNEGQYRVTWTKNSKRKIKIKISGEIPENAQWSVISNEENTRVSHKEGTATFTIKSVQRGDSNITICMRENEVPVETGADFEFIFSVNDKKKISLGSCVIKIMDTEHLETEKGVEVYCQKSNSGSLFIYLYGTDWCVHSCEGAVCVGPTDEGDMSKLEVAGVGTQSEGTLILADEINSEAVIFELCSDNESLKVQDVTDCDMEDLQEEEEIDQDYLELQDALNKAETVEEKDKLIAQYWAKQKEKNTEAYASNTEGSEGELSDEEDAG